MRSRFSRGRWASGLLAAGLAMASLCAGARAQGLARMENVDADPEQEIVAENAFYRMVVKPSESGAAVSLRVKPKGTEMVITAGKSGLMTDAIWQQGHGGDWSDAYDARIEENTPQGARIVLEKRGRTGGVLQWITIRRSLTLRADSPVVGVEVAVMNEDASMQPFRLGLWAHHQVGAAGQENTYFLPVASGVQRRVTAGGSSTQEIWDYDAARGWAAALAEDGCGVAFRMDYSRLMCFYQWLKGANRTVEWLYRSEEIPNGGAFRTTYQIIPFSGLPYVDGVGDGVAGAIVFEGQPLPGKPARGRVELSGAPGDVEAVVQWTRLPETTWKEAGRGVVRIGAGGAGNGAPFVFAPDGEGTYLARALLSRDGKESVALERVLMLGKASGRYVMAPECQRKGDDAERMARSLPLPEGAGRSAAAKIQLRDAPKDISYSLGVLSPHMAWARPYHLGPIKALVTTQTQSGRDIIEVAQRVDLDLKSVTLGAEGWKLPGNLVKGWNHQAAMLNLRRILQKEQLDVIALRIPWTFLDKESQGLILKRVEAGVGLVYVSYELSDTDVALFEMVGQGPAQKGHAWGGADAPWKILAPHYIAGALPYAMIRTPAYAFEPGKAQAVLGWKTDARDTPMTVVGQYGKGRVVCVNYNPNSFQMRCDQFTPAFPYRPFSRFDMPDHDASWPRFHWREYAYAMLSRCILWAANREPDLQVASATAEAHGDLGALSLETLNRGEAGKLAAEVLLRDGWSRLLSRQVADIEVAPGKGEVKVAFDARALPGGTSFVEFRLLNADGVVEFGAVALQRPEAAVAVKLSKYAHDTHEDAEAVVTVEGKAPDGAALVLKVEDHHGRVLSERKLAWDEAGGRLKVDLSRLETPGFVARAVVLKDGRALAEADCRGLKRIPTRYDDWMLGVEMHGASSASWQDAFYGEFVKRGYRLAHTGIRYTHGVASMRNNGMMAGDITGLMPDFRVANYNDVKRNYAQTGDLKWLERNPSPNDPAYRERVTKLVKTYAPYLRAYGIWDHTIIDELSVTLFNDTFDFSFDKHTLAKFREWVKTQYKDLAELNAAYGTQFAAWEEARPSTWAEAQQRGKYAGWADHRRFMELTLLECFEFIRAELKKMDPDAKISLSGTQAPHPYNGHDVWMRCKTFDGLWSYGGHEQYIMHREWGRRRKAGWYDFPWRGYAGVGPQMDTNYWHSALNQSTGAAYWWFLNVLNPDWRLSESGEWTDRATRDLREGLGKLIHDADLSVAPVALHYSQASCRGSYARGNFQTWNNTRTAWSGLLVGLGLQHTFLSYEQLEKGELAFPKTRVLILPYSIAMSDAEIGAVREFVRAGGCVIADFQTALMDERCRERGQGALDGVFGLKRLECGTGHVGGEPKLNAPAWGMEGADLRCKLEEPSVILDGGQALLQGANAPGVIVNRFGAGRAVYLNYAVARYCDLPERGEGAAMRSMVSAILREAGVDWPVTVRQGADALNPPEVEVYHYSLGAQELLGLMPRRGKLDGEKIKATVKLKQPRIVRELRGRRDFGRVASFDVEMEAPIAQLFSISTSAAQSVSVEAPGSARLGQAVKVGFAVAMQEGQPGARVARVTVTDPRGEPVVRWESNELLANGRGEKTLNLALNDPAGRYVVSVRDIASGASCERPFVAEAAERLSREGEAEKYPAAAPAKGATWRPLARPRAEFSPLKVEEAPVDFSRSLLKNTRLIEKDPKSAFPSFWHGGKNTPDGRRPLFPDYLAVAEDKEVLFRGAPTTRLEFKKAPGLWEMGQSLDLAPEGIGGKTIRVTFHLLRAQGEEAAGGYDMVVRLRPWKDGGVKGKAVDAEVSAPLNVWMTGTCEMKVDPSLDRVDVQVFGKKSDTLYLSGILVEVVRP